MERTLFRSAASLTGHPTVILYGAGGVGQDVYALLQRQGWAVRCVLDRHAQPGAHWDDTPIYLPDENPLTAAERASLPVIISVFNRDADIPGIARTLVGLEYGPCISFVDLHDRFAAELGDRFWLTQRSFYDEQAAAIAETAALWADEASRQLYAALIEFRRSGDYALLPPLETDRLQYFPADIPGWPITPLRLVDCGAYDGDTLAALVESNLATEAIAAFEPDLVNFQRLAARARAYSPMPAGGLTLWPCGVAAQTELLAFSAGQGEGSSLTAEGGTLIPCVALDDALPGFRPNLIKMDIEGAEPDALRGAESLIRQYHPGLAICVYHRPGHLWEIPQLIARWRLGYRFYLRAHGYSDFDVVLYALPI